MTAGDIYTAAGSATRGSGDTGDGARISRDSVTVIGGRDPAETVG
jgi:hypothetical protein